MDPLKREHVREAVREGWSASITRGSHVRLMHPSGALVIASGSPSDHRAAHQLCADLRRALRRIDRNQNVPNA
jgi:predicted RNA binding protein YcfA (HicA-like mRNA interferase family)